MRILLTGAAGFIGSHLCEALLARGDSVIGLDNFDPFYDRRVKERNVEALHGHADFTLIDGDIRDRETLDGCPEFDAVVHLAALAGVRPSIERPDEYVSVNVGGTSELLELVRRRDVKRFVFGSSSSVYGNNRKVPFSEADPVDFPISPYAATKRSGELICHTYHHLFGVGVVCLRFFTVYGPRQRPDLAIHKFTRLMKDGRPVTLFGDGTTRRDYTYIADIVQGVIGALDLVEREPEVFEILNLGESETIELSRMVATIADALDVEPVIEWLPEQPGDVRQTYADIQRARDRIDYRPSTKFDEGVPQFIEWFLKESG